MTSFILLVTIIIILSTRVIILEQEFKNLENRLEILEEDSIDEMIRAYTKNNKEIYDI